MSSVSQHPFPLTVLSFQVKVTKVLFIFMIVSRLKQKAFSLLIADGESQVFYLYCVCHLRRHHES